MEPSSAFPSTQCRVIDTAALVLDPEAVPSGQIVGGTPVTGHLGLLAGDAVAVGVWEHSEGTSTDVEADEVFVVLSGRATVTVEGGPVLELSPGSLGVLAAGARTTWVVHELLRKVYLSPA